MNFEKLSQTNMHLWYLFFIKNEIRKIEKIEEYEKISAVEMMTASIGGRGVNKDYGEFREFIGKRIDFYV